MNAHPGPIHGMRVLELAQIMAGPTCGMMLADMGADVVKVEKLPGGDDARGYREPTINGVSAPFLILNRNKRGIALNLKDPRGREILLRMVKDADVLTENYRRGTLEKLGLGYINAGILAVVGILAAYASRQTTGRGQIVDTSLMEAALQQTYWHAASYFATGESPGPTGSAHLLTAPYQAFRTRDGWINIGGGNQANWERIADVLGHPEWRSDPRFATNSARMENLDALSAAMDAVLVTRASAEWIAAFDAGGVPAGPVHTIGEALTHPQTLARGMVVDLVHPQAGATKALGCPVHFSATPTAISRAAPLLGEHTREVLAEHGFSNAEIDAFVDAGVAAAADGGATPECSRDVG